MEPTYLKCGRHKIFFENTLFVADKILIFLIENNTRKENEMLKDNFLITKSVSFWRTGMKLVSMELDYPWE